MFGKRFWSIFGLYGVLVLASLPLALSLVPPNRWYGFRLPGARFSPELWYEINALGGKLFIGALLVCVLLNLIILWKGPEAMQRILVWINAGLILLSFWLVSLELVQRLPF
jgi:hypothetical protein